MKTIFSGRRILRSSLAAAGLLAALGGAAVLTPSAARAQAAGAAGGKLVTINLQSAPVQTVLRSLFRSAGKNFTIDPAVTGFVTVDVNQVPFDTALSAVLAGTNPPLDAPLENGIYHVGVARAQAASQGAAPAAAPTPSTATDPHHAYRIPIAHFDAAYMSYLVAAFSQKGGAPIIVPADPTGQSGGMGGGMGGGMMGGGMMGGGMGGMGGGMMGGMGMSGMGGMGGGMGGMMGGMGGMMGGMGGMGGGMMGGMGGMGGGMMGGRGF